MPKKHPKKADDLNGITNDDSEYTCCIGQSCGSFIDELSLHFCAAILHKEIISPMKNPLEHQCS